MPLPRRTLFAILLCGALGLAQAQSAPWLLGRWELKFDPDGSPKDEIEFSTSSQVVSVAPNGRQTQGIYAWKDGEVKVSFALPDGTFLPLSFVPSPDRRQLRITSARTGKTAVYEKVATK